MAAAGSPDHSRGPASAMSKPFFRVEPVEFGRNSSTDILGDPKNQLGRSIRAADKMSDDRIQSKPVLTTGLLAGRTIRFETTDKVLAEVNRRRDRVFARVLPRVAVSFFVSVLLVAWGYGLGDGAVILALTVGAVIVGLTLIWTRASVNTLAKFLAYRSKYPNRWTEVVFSDDGFQREDALYRATLPWNAFESIYRSEGYWEFAAMGGIEVVPSEFIDPELADFIETQATLNRIPVHFEPSFQRKLEKATGRQFIQKAMKPAAAWTWIVVLVAFLLVMAFNFNSLSKKKNQPPPDKKGLQH